MCAPATQAGKPGEEDGVSKSLALLLGPGLDVVDPAEALRVGAPAGAELPLGAEFPLSPTDGALAIGGNLALWIYGDQVAVFVAGQQFALVVWIDGGKAV